MHFYNLYLQMKYIPNNEIHIDNNNNYNYNKNQ